MIYKKISSYKDLIVWQKSVEVVKEVYSLTKHFPQSEQYGLVSQMRRSAVSIPSNIAEGKRRITRMDYRRFLIIAYSSGAELETQIEISKQIDFNRKLDFFKTDSLLNEIMRMLNKITNQLK